jgi:hypothetical protein
MFVRSAIAFAFAVTSAAALAEGPLTAPTITGMKAQLFRDNQGTFGEDFLALPDQNLFNVIIGEDASSATLVTVEVSGKNLPLGDYKVEIVATGEKGKVVAKSTQEVTIYDAKTKFYAPVLINDTGCRPIKVTAKLAGKGLKAKPMTKTLDFLCGE